MRNDMSPEVKIKVTGPSNLRKWPKSKSISFAICEDILSIVDDYNSTEHFPNLIEPDFRLLFHGTSKLIENAYFH